MCGICGYLDRSAARDEDARRGRGMMDALGHCGPHAEGLRVSGPAALGHRRLSVIDLRAEANQPFIGEGGDSVLVANCEIYNFEELRRRLERLGHRFRSRSDAEVILHL